jgi:hypothetical protein
VLKKVHTSGMVKQTPTFRVLFVLLALVFLSLPMQQSQAIQFGCGSVQKSVTSLNSKFISNANREQSLIKSYRYKEAYKAYWTAQKDFKTMYDAVLKSSKCFSVSFRKNLISNYSSYYTQVGACDRYGYQICSQWIKAPSMPCDDTRTKEEYIFCMEGQARVNPDYNP